MQGQYIVPYLNCSSLMKTDESKSPFCSGRNWMFLSKTSPPEMHRLTSLNPSKLPLLGLFEFWQCNDWILIWKPFSWDTHQSIILFFFRIKPCLWNGDEAMPFILPCNNNFLMTSFDCISCIEASNHYRTERNHVYKTKCYFSKVFPIAVCYLPVITK